MYTPWFAGTDESAQLAQRICEHDYLHFLEAGLQETPDTTNRWLTIIALRFADLLINSGYKIKQQAAHQQQRTSFQTH